MSVKKVIMESTSLHVYEGGRQGVDVKACLWCRRHHMSKKGAIMVSTSLNVCEGCRQGVDVNACL